MESIVIRQAGAEDADAISALVHEVASGFLLNEFSEEGKQHFLRSIEPDAIVGYLDGSFVYFLAESGEELAGLIAMRDFRHLYHLFVRTAFHRRGIARSLWEHARAQCLEAGNPGEFTVNSSAYAQEVYRKWGFEPTGPPFEKAGIVSTPMLWREQK